ncbi:GH1 family beta-glucosidase [Flavobacterium pallidum]|uniref:Beta-glucosidase n=1 Tax=Flavobacterium pallidum TaxID=2172098 RepID=A0A2S1SIU2_9FLAO|nr:GH1 family beta-glucosidase [Flavobacterium pallidum]AWI26262.1 beta-glucosidase [Flavobacterium pallidum]
MEEKHPLQRQQFGPGFHWGVSTAAFQIEGAVDVDGKGPSIWDTFTAKKGTVRNNDHAGMACDFYNRYEDDIALLRQLHIPDFRFSLSWSRILPNGQGNVNQKGIDYYNRVIDHLLECGISPWATLYHWDLPQALQDKGGWTNRDSISWFADYAALCAKHFGDRIPNWMVMNEPSVFTGAGYFLGIHAPGKRGLASYLKSIHHVTMATAAGGRILRSDTDSQIGTTFSFTHIEPHTQRSKDMAACARVDTLLNRTFIEPILGMGYPDADLAVLRKMRRYMQPDDEQQMAFNFDFIGAQCYTREIVRSRWLTPYIGAALVPAAKRSTETTDMGWEVHPPSMYHTLKRLHTYKNINKIIITENGAAFPDDIVNRQVYDGRRRDYLKAHLREVLRAKLEGVNVHGYFVWTLTDNFEWAEGYHPRFGLVHVDFETQQRTIKQSGYWYRDFLSDL